MRVKINLVIGPEFRSKAFSKIAAKRKSITILALQTISKGIRKADSNKKPKTHTTMKTLVIQIIEPTVVFAKDPVAENLLAQRMRC